MLQELWDELFRTCLCYHKLMIILLAILVFILLTKQTVTPTCKG